MTGEAPVAVETFKDTPGEVLLETVRAAGLIPSAKYSIPF